MSENIAKNVGEVMTVLLVEPDKRPTVIEIEDTLENLQSVVGGLIEVVYPFDDTVGLIMNEEGKIMSLPPNRGLLDRDGNVYDVIAGPFMVVGLTDEGFCSLTPEKLKTYEEIFHDPEAFLWDGKTLHVMPVPDAD